MNSQEHLMDAKIKAEFLSHAVTAARSVQDDCIIQIYDDRLEFRVDDPSNVACAVVTLRTEAFEEFEATAGKVGFNLKELRTALKHIDPEALTTIRFNETGTNLFLSGGGQEFDLKPLVLEHVECNIQELSIDHQAMVKIPGNEFTQAVNAANDFSDYLIFYIQEDEESLKLRGEGDMHETERTLGPDVLEEIEIGPAYNVYSLDYLSQLTAAITDDATVELELAREDRPMNLEFDIAESGGLVEYTIAPHIR